ncbi:MAG: hypothetical protein IBX53_05580 [Halomonas sp.]|uniref:hypothetical protein n=1 Tax=Halomonas sp. TaxID=1486246 RepID=UPI0019DE624C|nr:hypothetical protein [Halomonas sp.]MBE0488530.1 hypothetical protein [Halomonas sp.]
MISKSIRKSIGIFSIAMGLVASPLALSDQLTLPAVIVTAEELASPSMRSNPVNDPRDLTQPAFRGHPTSVSMMLVSPSYQSQPINDPFHNGDYR